MFMCRHPNNQEVSTSDVFGDCSILYVCNVCKALIFPGLQIEFFVTRRRMHVINSQGQTWASYVILEGKFNLIHKLATHLHVFSLINIHSDIIGIVHNYIQYICPIAF